MKTAIFSLVLFLSFSFSSIACSCMGIYGLCYVMDGDSVNVAMGDIIDTLRVPKLDSLGMPTDSLYTGLVFRVKDDLRLTGLNDTITIWSYSESWQGICYSSVEEYTITENIIFPFFRSTFSIDTVEQYDDFKIITDLCSPGYLIVDGDSVRAVGGLIYSGWSDTNLFNATHPATFHKSKNSLYSDFKNRLQNNLPCLDYTSIQELPSAAINIYPNPATDIITFNLTSNFNPNTVKLYNLQGQEVYTNQLKANTIDVSTLPSGLYFIELSNGEQLVRKKVFVN